MVFNGRASQYATSPLEVAPGELLRLYLVNAGPNRISSFHVVGEIFERVFQDGGGSIFELRLAEPGDYPFVTHAFADATKGAVGVLRAQSTPGSAQSQAPAGARR